jgi:hypothetical protein
MNEMTHNNETILGGSVKKTLLVAALAAMLVFAFSGAAFAAGINHSGQARLGARVPVVTNPGTPPTYVSGGEGTLVNGNKTGTDTYYDWNATLLDNAGNGNSPHGNYTTTTVKCVVCHSVHYAAANGAPVGSPSGTADTLLRMRADQACVFCHATAGEAVNGRPVYNGLGGVIVGPGNTGGATNNGHITGTNCTYCHTNVHGAGADESVAALQGYLLKTMSATPVGSTTGNSTDMISAITAIDHNAVNQGFTAGDALAGTIGAYATSNTTQLREQAVGVFCAECHNGAYATGAAGAATNVLNAGSPVAYSGHRINAAATSGNTWNAAGDKSTGLVQGKDIAWAAANDCKSCHDATDDYGNLAFPHSWGKSGLASSKMWLQSAADAGGPKTSVGPAASSTYNSSTNPVQLTDGVCLKCHVASGGAAGVGITF